MNRSWVFIPGNREKFLRKAPALDADNIIFDLEDSVATKEKENARLKVKDALSNIETKSNKYVRVNGLNSSYIMNDLQQLTLGEIDGFMIPNVNGREDIIVVDYLISQLEREKGLEVGKLSIIPLIETGKGLQKIDEIIVASKRIKVVAFGAEDFMLDMNIPKDDENTLLMARSKLVVSSRAANIQPPIDSVYTDIHNEDGLTKATLIAKNLGFQGKLIIHPSQLKIVNEIFIPTESELKEAKKIVRAYEQSKAKGIGSIQVDGQMVDVPVVERARKILSGAGIHLS